MSGTWLVSYGVLWTLLLLNFVLAYAITTLLARVRARWHDDMRQFEIPFVGGPPQPRAPVYIDLSGGAPANGTAAAAPPTDPAPTAPPAKGKAPASVPGPDPRPGPGPIEWRHIPGTLPALPAAARGARLDAVSVIIPTADSPSWLGPCLRDLRQAEGSLRLQVICVFSAAPVMSAEICERYNAQVVRARGRFSFARSVNLGFSRTTEPLILLLNNDVSFQNLRDLERLVAVLHENPSLGAVGPVSSNVVSDIQCRPAADLDGGPVHPGYSLIGHCVLLRREMLDAVGPFDEKFRGYGYDEVDWFWRARGLGYRWAVDETTWVEHAGSASFSQAEIQSGMEANRRRFEEKWDQDPHAPGAWDWPAPLVSIVMTAFNAEPWLDRCFGSIMHSGLGDFEVVCVDDGSADGTSQVIRHWSRLLPIKHARFPKAENVARAKNRALRMASGRYIALMDADDEMPQERIPFLLRAIEDTDADLVYGGFEIRPDRTVTYIPARMVPAGEWDLRDYARTEVNWVCPCATLFRRKLLDEGLFFDEALPAYEDYEWVLAAGLRGYRIREAPGPSCHVYHRRHQTTLESYEWETLRDGIRRRHGLAAGVLGPGSD